MLHHDFPDRYAGFGCREPARGVHELVAIVLREIEVDGRPVPSLLVKEEAAGLHPVLEVAVGDVARFGAR